VKLAADLQTKNIASRGRRTKDMDPFGGVEHYLEVFTDKVTRALASRYGLGGLG
jgi:hypothetical protein